MPKFVSGSSGRVYANNKSGKPSDDEDETVLLGNSDHRDSVKKPSAINKKGSKEKQKNSLDLFKEELRRLQEEKDEQRNKGWGKAVPLPQNPVFVPAELLKLTLPPPFSGLPFNGQLHKSDVDRGYVIPNPHPRPLPAELESEAATNPNLRSIKETYEEFVDVVRRSTVKVIIPTDVAVLERIHKTIEYVIKEGPVFEAIIIARENKNPAYAFLYDNKSPEHVYYRWKLYSILHGDNPYAWRTDEFRMFEGGALWSPPPLNPYAEGMPEELLTKPASLDKFINEHKTPKKSKFFEGSFDMRFHDSRVKGTLGQVKRDMLGDLLRNLDPTKKKIGALMMFCINYADAAKEIVECICESLMLLETPFQKKIARLFLVSDILHNCSAAVTNASYYRQGFQSKLVSLFEHLREYLINIEDRYKADRFKQKVLSVLGAWKEWTLYEDEFVIKLSNILLGIKHDESVISAQKETKELEQKKQEESLDGEALNEETLGKCLEVKGLSLRWYKTLELSEDEYEEEEEESSGSDSRSGDRSPGSSKDERVRFKTSKWETVDPSQVAEQVVTISKWESQYQEEEKKSASDSSDSAESGRDPGVKKFKSTTDEG